MTTTDNLHVVLGATGGVGSAVVRALVAQGKSVRAVTRTGTGVEQQGVECRSGDISNLETARSVCDGAAVVYFCANPPYNTWPQLFPPMLAGAIAGASATSAKLIAADNLYVYAPTTQPMTEDLPMAPITRKGKVRAAMDATLLAAHRVGTVRAAIGRASDFYGPGALNATVGGSRFFKALLAGKPVEWLGRLDVPHSFSYIEDFGRGLVTLGAHEAALGQAWHIPAAEPLTGQQMLAMLFAEAGITAKITRITPALLRLAGIFNPMAHEMQEMIYEFTAPYIIDGTKFTRAFGGTPTSHQVAVRATVAWFKQQHALHA